MSRLLFCVAKMGQKMIAMWYNVNLFNRKKQHFDTM